jgi:hypothetical protein
MPTQAAMVRDVNGIRYFYVAEDGQADAERLLRDLHPGLDLANATWRQLNDVFGPDLERGEVLEWIIGARHRVQPTGGRA